MEMTALAGTIGQHLAAASGTFSYRRCLTHEQLHLLKFSVVR